ncbi:hypothetical protein PHYSODRAFT_346496 [Phytophthora sojae]|uniref:Zuotin-like zuotin homology domain-containing protein n=1 Tax=Phytophthora sojae (strain P6497) TaxID=1094619 RepID=G4ZQA2_PHYSP|nr:hypothetical protein PHYSODRAFT_346496 [Phytophthora sojae]EGZ14813.1 hypothetical protein PHYSODRAFT_346496 [Phytophthora sojae]|eukprot:XP_009528562.1 hypothetical protein PHYSODRAFT_346496 [Phytophthora sojae]
MEQAADDAPRAAPPFPSASGDLVLAAASLDIPASDVALAQTVHPCKTLMSPTLSTCDLSELRPRPPRARCLTITDAPQCGAAPPPPTKNDERHDVFADAVAATPPADFKEPKVVLSLGGYFAQRRVEAVGRAFNKRVCNMARGCWTSCEDLDDATKVRDALRKQEEFILRKYRRSIRGKNFLELQLGLSDIDFDVTDEQFKKAYRTTTGKTENDPNYLAVQKAFATPIDPQKKRAAGYEKIKENDPADEGKSFYELYGPVFLANARFSENKPAPASALGGDDLHIDEVYAFYDFWNKFDSWRVFTHDSEHDVDSAEHRDHKRWMAKKNEAAAKKEKRQDLELALAGEGDLYEDLDAGEGIDYSVDGEQALDLNSSGDLDFSADACQDASGEMNTKIQFKASSVDVELEDYSQKLEFEHDVIDSAKPGANKEFQPDRLRDPSEQKKEKMAAASTETNEESVLFATEVKN